MQIRQRGHVIFSGGSLAAVEHRWLGNQIPHTYQSLRLDFSSTVLTPKLYATSSHAFLEELIVGTAFSTRSLHDRRTAINLLIPNLINRPQSSILPSEKARAWNILLGAMNRQNYQLQHVSLESIAVVFLHSVWQPSHMDLLQMNILFRTDGLPICIDLEPQMMRTFPWWYDPLTISLDYLREVALNTEGAIQSEDMDLLLGRARYDSECLTKELSLGQWDAPELIEMWCVVAGAVHGWNIETLYGLHADLLVKGGLANEH
jgi:hypothetical protein